MCMSVHFLRFCRLVCIFKISDQCGRLLPGLLGSLVPDSTVHSLPDPLFHHTHAHTQTCWHAHLSLGKPPQAVALAQRHSLSWVKMLGAKMHPVKMLRISRARIDKHKRWFEEKWCWSNTVDAYDKDALRVFDDYKNSLVDCVTASKTYRNKQINENVEYIL